MPASLLYNTEHADDKEQIFAGDMLKKHKNLIGSACYFCHFSRSMTY